MARISKDKREEIKIKIKQVAKASFDELGFENTSTKKIAKEVGIAEGTLFNYFDSKTELFFEVFGDSYQEYAEKSADMITIGENIGEILLSHFKKMFNFILKLPKGIMSELTVASVRMARKHPDRFKKLAQYDLDLIDELQHYVKRLVEEGILKPVDEKHFGEMIFSIIGYEMFIYDDTTKKEDVYENIKKKIDILVLGYIEGGEK